MNINDTKNVEQLMQFQIFTNILKEASNNSSSFNLAMESLMASMSEKNESSSTYNSTENIQNIKDKFNLKDSDLDNLSAVYEDLNKSIKNGNSEILSLVDKASKKYNIDKELILSVIQQESSFNPNCTSHAGAMGLMQLMPENCEDLNVANPYNIAENIDAGTHHLKDMLKMHNYNKKLALAAYNAGCGTLKRRNVSNENEIYKLPKETQNYVKKVINYYGKAKNIDL